MLIPVDVNLMFKKLPCLICTLCLLSNYFNLNFPLNGINIMLFKKFGIIVISDQTYLCVFSEVTTFRIKMIFYFPVSHHVKVHSKKLLGRH